MREHQPMCTSNKTTCNGFTIIEFIVLFVVIAVLTTIAMVNLPDIRHYRQTSAVDRVISDLTCCRNIAQSRARHVRVSFNPGTDSYTVEVANDSGGWTALQDPLTQNAWNVNISTLFPGTGLQSVNVNGGTVLIFSSTNGIPCDGNLVPISSDAIITFDSGHTVHVVPDTGYVY
jgi:Tfp pilus assembly protein FimT